MAIDIDQSFYNTGTASVTNGGIVVTGQGTQWTSSIRANDIFGTHKGDGVRILSVESNTSLTLAYPWTGETQATAPYEVQFTPYDTGYYPAVRQLLQTMASGNVESFASLVGAPNRVPIFTGPGAMTLADPATFGIEDPNGSLAKLASSTTVANRSLQTDNSNNIVFAPLGLELIASDTNNNEVAAWVKTGLGTTYREIFLFVDAAPVTSGMALNIQLSTDNGVTWLTATTEYTEQALVAAGTTVTAVSPASPGIGSGATASSAAGGGAIMDIKLGEFNQFRRTMYSAFISRRVASGAMELVTRNGLVTPWAPFNAIRLVCSNGNLARFRIVLMGVRG